MTDAEEIVRRGFQTAIALSILAVTIVLLWGAWEYIIAPSLLFWAKVVAGIIGLAICIVLLGLLNVYGEQALKRAYKSYVELREQRGEA